MGPIVQSVSPHVPGFIIGLFVAFFVWIFIDRKQIKAELADLKAKAVPAVTTISHDLHVAEAMPKIMAEDFKNAFLKLIGDAEAEATRLEAAKAALAAPAAAAPTPSPDPTAHLA